MIKYICTFCFALLLVCSSNGYAQKKGGRSSNKTRARASQAASQKRSVENPTGSEALPALTKEELEQAAQAATAELAAEDSGKAAQQAAGKTGQDTPVAQEGAASAEVETSAAQATVQTNAQGSGGTQASAAGTAQAETEGSEVSEGFVVQREEVTEERNLSSELRVVFNPKNQRDPTLSPDDLLILNHREQMRLAAIEAEKQRKLAEERRKREEAERQRLLELERLKDPTKEVRGKIRVSGVIGQEVFIGNKIYTIGNTIFGARIVEVNPDYVVFSYKGHKFRKNVQL